MSEIEKAIDYFETQKKLFPHSYNVASGYFDIAIKSIGNQIPKKIAKDDKYYFNANDEPLGHGIYCPTCKEPICYENSQIDCFGYCTKCGQKLDWSENNG